ncbi:MAG: hypothetical protein IJ370_02365, partial [Oscillospiraceae bacterium]|nr:hypothetical protein [Oscillospiraceae bacterium]
VRSQTLYPAELTAHKPYTLKVPNYIIIVNLYCQGFIGKKLLRFSNETQNLSLYISGRWGYNEGSKKKGGGV